MFVRASRPVYATLFKLHVKYSNLIFEQIFGKLTVFLNISLMCIYNMCLGIIYAIRSNYVESVTRVGVACRSASRLPA